MFVCMGACVGVFVCMYALRIVSMDKILCFINTLIIIVYQSCAFGKVSEISSGDDAEQKRHMDRMHFIIELHLQFVIFVWQVFKNLFKDGLAIQKDRIREVRRYAKEQREKQAKKRQDEIDSLEN